MEVTVWLMRGNAEEEEEEEEEEEDKRRGTKYPSDAPAANNTIPLMVKISFCLINLTHHTISILMS